MKSLYEKAKTALIQRREAKLLLFGWKHDPDPATGYWRDPLRPEIRVSFELAWTIAVMRVTPHNFYNSNWNDTQTCYLCEMPKERSIHYDPSLTQGD